MTLPDERYRAVVQTKKFLIDLCSPKRTPRVPKDIRQLANSLLRHYPSDWDMTIASQQAPDVFAERMEDVTRLIKQYEISKAEKNEA
ncbi:MAG: hypothetical protein RLZZ196_1885 [Bacteroidota bacterium]|jgi:hypothetical protein